MSDRDVDRVWVDYWVPTLREALLERGVQVDGDENSWTVDTPELWEQLKRELFDFHSVMQAMPWLYDHAAIDEYYTDVARDQLIDVMVDLDQPGDDPRSVEIIQDVFERLREAFCIGPDEVTDAAKRRKRIRAMLAKKAETHD